MWTPRGFGAEGLRVSLAASKDRLARADNAIARRGAAGDVGMPGFHEIAGRTLTASDDRLER